MPRNAPEHAAYAYPPNFYTPRPPYLYKDYHLDQPEAEYLAAKNEYWNQPRLLL